MPLNVAATSVKLAIPPPITRALLRPSGSAVAHCTGNMCLSQQIGDTQTDNEGVSK